PPPGAPIVLVGATGFEPATTGPPVRCATRLRYAPIKQSIFAETMWPFNARAGRAASQADRGYGEASRHTRLPGCRARAEDCDGFPRVNASSRLRGSGAHRRGAS